MTSTYAACEELYAAVDPAGVVCSLALTPDQMPSKATAYCKVSSNTLRLDSTHRTNTYSEDVQDQGLNKFGSGHDWHA